MVVQLPDGALAAAVGVQIYSHICLICSSLMILLVCKHRARDSCENSSRRRRVNVYANNSLDVALLAYTTFLSTAGSIAQQLHTIVLWDEIKTEQFYYVHDHLGSPEIAIAGTSYGLDLVLFYIRASPYLTILELRREGGC